MKIAEIKKELIKMDPKLDIDSPAGIAAQMLLASTQVGPHMGKIAMFMRQNPGDIREMAKRAKENGIWKNGKVHASWFDEDGAVGFWMDVNVVLGLMKRVR